MKINILAVSTGHVTPSLLEMLKELERIEAKDSGRLKNNKSEVMKNIRAGKAFISIARYLETIKVISH